MIEQIEKMFSVTIVVAGSLNLAFILFWMFRDEGIYRSLYFETLLPKQLKRNAALFFIGWWQVITSSLLVPLIIFKLSR